MTFPYLPSKVTAALRPAFRLHRRRVRIDPALHSATRGLRSAEEDRQQRSDDRSTVTAGTNRLHWLFERSPDPRPGASARLCRVMKRAALSHRAISPRFAKTARTHQSLRPQSTVQTTYGFELARVSGWEFPGSRHTHIKERGTVAQPSAAGGAR